MADVWVTGCTVPDLSSFLLNWQWRREQWRACDHCTVQLLAGLAWPSQVPARPLSPL